MRERVEALFIGAEHHTCSAVSITVSGSIALPITQRQAYVGVIAQEVERVMPTAGVRGRDRLSTSVLLPVRRAVPNLRSVDRVGRACSCTQ